MLAPDVQCPICLKKVSQLSLRTHSAVCQGAKEDKQKRRRLQVAKEYGSSKAESGPIYATVRENVPPMYGQNVQHTRHSARGSAITSTRKPIPAPVVLPSVRSFFQSKPGPAPVQPVKQTTTNTSAIVSTGERLPSVRYQHASPDSSHGVYPSEVLKEPIMSAFQKHMERVACGADAAHEYLCSIRRARDLMQQHCGGEKDIKTESDYCQQSTTITMRTLRDQGRRESRPDDASLWSYDRCEDDVHGYEDQRQASNDIHDVRGFCARVLARVLTLEAMGSARPSEGTSVFVDGKNGVSMSAQEGAVTGGRRGREKDGREALISLPPPPSSSSSSSSFSSASQTAPPIVPSWTTPRILVVAHPDGLGVYSAADIADATDGGTAEQIGVLACGAELRVAKWQLPEIESGHENGPHDEQRHGGHLGCVSSSSSMPPSVRMPVAHVSLRATGDGTPLGWIVPDMVQGHCLTLQAAASSGLLGQAQEGLYRPLIPASISCCPVCGVALKLGTTETEVQAHVSECLASHWE